jgi:hypothetical protein
MVTTIKQTEGTPASYPAAPSGLSTEAAALDAAMIWQRIESYIAHRFSARNVVWIVEGPGEWIAPLAPATISTIERWDGGAFVADDSLSASPLGGYCLPGCGPYRFTARVGAGPVPAIVSEAYRRLAEYFADVADAAATRETAGVMKSSFTIGHLSEDRTRAQAWAAKAMENSGAGDLLRAYRRAI